MSSSGKGDANSYWPGFVDALTNVVIAMIFVVVVLAISLSFAARLMGQKIAEQYIKEHQEKTPKAAPTADPAPDAAVKVTQRIAVAGNEKAASAARPARVRNQDQLLQLDYAPGAVTLDGAAADQLKQVLSKLEGEVAGRRVQIVASGPDMAFSDNQRAAFLRVMGVRNLLIESGFTPERIGMEVDTKRETSTTAVNLSFSSVP